MKTCSACHQASSDEARFCSACGAPFALLVPEALSSQALAPSATAIAETRERRLATALFCDLVGYTRLCESHDPEDVSAFLAQFFALVREEIGRFGGVVEKYLGDAALGLFGVPVAHEDDPQRAIYAALRIREAVAALTPPSDDACRVRIGIECGEALARLDAVAGSGEALLVGDPLNVAARLEAQAAPDQIVVGATAHMLASRWFEFTPLPFARLKGKRDPVPCWSVTRAVARTGVEVDRFGGAFIGRRRELVGLVHHFDAARAEKAPRFVLVSGEAGVGKSRLLFELAQELDCRVGLIATWRQGRCLPYGTDVAFWALAEIVRSEAGILESDDPQQIEEKLQRAVPTGEEREWLLGHLRPLVGLASPASERAGHFAAWTSFLAGLAHEGAAVVVLEDLHWAQEGTLAFLAQLTRELTGVPLLVVATARPELLEARPDVAEGWTEVTLKPLSAKRTGRLVGHLCGPAELSATVRERLVERSGGNPLYVEELVRLAREQSRATRLGAQRSTAEAMPPQSLRALIAARLHTLKARERTLLLDAAVVGDVFWPGAVVAAGASGDGLKLALDHLVQREFLRARASSTIAGEAEYAFWHTLTREVAYAQLTRERRAQKHARVARWIEGAASGRAVDLLAHHYESALDLAAASGEEELLATLRQPAAKALEQAGDQAFSLDVAVAEQRYARAATLLEKEDVRRPGLLRKWSDALRESGREREALDMLDEIIAALQASGRHEELAEALTDRALRLWEVDASRMPSLPPVAEELLRDGKDSAHLVQLLEDWAYICFFNDDRNAGVAAAKRALEVARRLGLSTPILALELLGIARCEEGDAAGFDDLRAALAEARGRGAERRSVVVAVNLADQVCAVRGPADAAAIRREALAGAQRRGDELSRAELMADLAGDLLWCGAWDEADALLDAVDPLIEKSGRELLGKARARAALVCLLRGRLEDAERLATWADRFFFDSTRFETRSLSLMVLAFVRAARGGRDAAAALLRTCDELKGGGRRLPGYVLLLAWACRVAIDAGDEALAQRLTAELGPRPLDEAARASLAAALADAHDEPGTAALYADAARRWGELKVPCEQALALLRRARCFSQAGSSADAAADLHTARAIFTSLGARPALAETESLLAVMSSGSG